MSNDKQIARWADPAMFQSERHDASTGPRVHLLAMNADPLGQIAACAKMYVGEVVRDLSEVTDDERRKYLAEMQKTKLAMPLESVQLHFMLENVTRAFTHQLVRQRTAAYAQESMRFAVVEDMTEAVAFPPSLAGTLSHGEWMNSLREKFNVPPEEMIPQDIIEKNTPSQQHQRLLWDESVSLISDNYNALVNSGMPAEDARGLMPTNIITRVNYITNLRGLLDHAGNRLCTQAQFEWRLVFAGIAAAIAEYDNGGPLFGRESSEWQYRAIAGLLKPVCYQTGRCAFKADFDRKCSIRDRVDLNAAINRPSSEWDVPVRSSEMRIDAIHPAEWLMDPGAAR